MTEFAVKVYHGPMYCGKTAKLVEEYEKEQKSVVFRPEIDNRYGYESRIYSKIPGVSAPATEIEHLKPELILKYVEQMDGIYQIVIDEASFFPIDAFLKVVLKLINSGNKVVVGGLTHDSDRRLWGPIPELLKWPEVEEKALTAWCDGEGRECQIPAIWSYAKAKKATQLVVGADELYGASCERHYNILHVPGTDGS